MSTYIGLGITAKSFSHCALVSTAKPIYHKRNSDIGKELMAAHHCSRIIILSNNIERGNFIIKMADFQSCFYLNPSYLIRRNTNTYLELVPVYRLISSSPEVSSEQLSVWEILPVGNLTDGVEVCRRYGGRQSTGHVISIYQSLKNQIIVILTILI